MAPCGDRTQAHKSFANLFQAPAGAPTRAARAGGAGTGLLAQALRALLAGKRVTPAARAIRERRGGCHARANAAFSFGSALTRALAAGRGGARAGRRERTRLHIASHARAV